MATLRKRKQRWQVQIRRKNHLTQTASFDTRRQAQTWARRQESRLDCLFEGAQAPDPSLLTLAALVRRYRDQEVPKKRSAAVERIILNAFLRTPLAQRNLSEISTGCFAAYRDQRLEKVKAATVCRELAIYQHMFGVAMREWGLALPVNPLSSLRKPKRNHRPAERVSEDDLAQIRAAANHGRTPLIIPLIEFALETAMRRGEILALQSADLNTERGLLHIPRTKNGCPRTVPLTPRALQIVSRLKPDLNGFLFPISASALGQCWRRLVRRAGVAHLRFHDLRHEAVTRLFEIGLTMPEVALISGHKDHRMLMHYTHLKPIDVRSKLIQAGAAP